MGVPSWAKSRSLDSQSIQIFGQQKPLFPCWGPGQPAPQTGPPLFWSTEPAFSVLGGPNQPAAQTGPSFLVNRIRLFHVVALMSMRPVLRSRPWPDLPRRASPPCPLSPVPRALPGIHGVPAHTIPAILGPLRTGFHGKKWPRHSGGKAEATRYTRWRAGPCRAFGVARPRLRPSDRVCVLWGSTQLVSGVDSPRWGLWGKCGYDRLASTKGLQLPRVETRQKGKGVRKNLNGLSWGV